MKVYSLEQENVITNSSAIFGIYNKPKDARKAVDELFSINTKHKWKKDGERRYYEMENFTWIVIEWKVQGKKYDD